jgi:alkaline phosphatase D
MIDRSCALAVCIGAVASLAAYIGNPGSAAAATAFTAVAAGDMTASDAVLWTRTTDPASGQPVAAGVTAQLAAESEFRKILFTYHGEANAARAGTIKIETSGLASHTRYFYRFVAEDGGVSPSGQFTTAPAENEKVAIRFAFSGDAHGAWRPYPLLHRFAELRLDYFVFLGDTMYESASKGSPPAADPFADPAQALSDYRRKYLENIVPVKAGGFPGLQGMFAAQGNYTLLDNHELGNAQFVSGGASPGNPPGAGVMKSPENDVNASCDFINRTPGFAALLQAYRDFQPIRELRVSAPGDCRSDGTWRLYFAQRWARTASSSTSMTARIATFRSAIAARALTIPRGRCLVQRSLHGSSAPCSMLRKMA